MAGELISRWNSDLILPRTYGDTQLSAYGSPNQSQSAPVGYVLPAIDPPSTLIPVQLPSAAVDDILVTTVTIRATIAIIQSAGGNAGPGAIVDAVGTLIQNYVDLLTIPLNFISWGIAGGFIGFQTFEGSVTPVTPFPVYQSDTYQMKVSLGLTQPIPQNGEVAAPGGIANLILLDPVWSQFYLNSAKYASKVSFMGTKTAKEYLF